MKRKAVFVFIIILMLAFVSCSNKQIENEDIENLTFNVDNAENGINPETNVRIGEIIGNYKYPENPAKQLRSALEDDIIQRGLPMSIGTVERIQFDNKDCSQIRIDFNNSENVCVITFINEYLEYGYDNSLDERYQPLCKMEIFGSGGIWPRPHRGIIQGIERGSAFSVGQELNITVSGYNMNLEKPKDQRFRWVPVSWRISDGSNGIFSSEAPFQAVLPLNNTGEQHLYITYLEEVFDWLD